jgi:hypothetical protein
MKQLIVLTAMIALGIAIFSMIAGSDDESLLGTMKSVWNQELQERTRLP